MTLTILGSGASGRWTGNNGGIGLAKTGEVLIETEPPDAEMVLTCPAGMVLYAEVGLDRFLDKANREGGPRTELSPIEIWLPK